MDRIADPVKNNQIANSATSQARGNISTNVESLAF